MKFFPNARPRVQSWLNRLLGGVSMGLGWGVAWVPVAVLVAFIIDPNDSMDEPWLIVGMLPGFLCGAVFSALSEVADAAHEHRGLDGLSFGRACARGVASGLLVGAFWLVLALLSDPPRWLLNAVVIGSVTLLSAVSGVGAAALARMGKSNASARVA